MILEPVRLVDGRAEAPCSLTTTSLLRSSQSQHPTRHLSQTAPVSFLGRGRGTSPCSFSGFPLGGSQEPRRLRRPTDEEPLTYRPTPWNRGRRRRRRRRSWVQLAARGPTGWPAPVPVPAELAGPTVKRRESPHRPAVLRSPIYHAHERARNVDETNRIVGTGCIQHTYKCHGLWQDLPRLYTQHATSNKSWAVTLVKARASSRR